MYLAGAFVEAEPVPAGVPHTPVGGPLGERDLAGQPGFHPVRAAGIPRRHRRAERAGIALERAQLPQQVGEHRRGEPGADVPRVPQPVIVIDTQQQRADRVSAAALTGSPPADDDLLVPDVLDLDPVPAPARMIAGGQRLADHPPPGQL